MSVVVAVHKNDSIVMAADTLTCFADDEQIPQDNSRSVKIVRIGRSIIGGAGWGVYDDIFNDFLADRHPPELGSERAIFQFFLDLWKALHEKYTFVNDQAGNKDSPFGDLDSSFLIVNATGVYRVCSDLSVSRFNQYHAVGSGSPYALGAMQALFDTDMDGRQIAERAVRAAMAFNVYCGGAVDVLEVER